MTSREISIRGDQDNELVPQAKREISANTKRSLDVPDISDERIREILLQFSGYLFQGIDHSDTFHAAGAGKSPNDAVPIDDEEFHYWDSRYDLQGRLAGKIASQTLYVADRSNKAIEPKITDANPSPSGSGTKLLRPQQPDQFRVNLDQPFMTEIRPFDSSNGVQLLIRPEAHMGGSQDKGKLFNAFVALDMCVKDSLDRWGVDRKPGTGEGPSPKPVFSPYKPCEMSCWFNTSIDPTKPNLIENKGNGIIWARVHNPEKLDELKIPDDPDIRLFFWQLDRFLATGNRLTQQGDAAMVLDETRGKLFLGMQKDQQS